MYPVSSLPMFPTTTMPHYLYPSQPYSPAPYGSQLPPYTPPMICPTFDVMQRLQSCVSAPTPQMKQHVVEHVLKARESSPVVANYIDFVLAYRTNFRICVINMREAHSAGYMALFRHYSENIIVNELILYSPLLTLAEAFRHEFRHAYWDTFHIYTSGKAMLTDNDPIYHPACYSPTTPVEQKKIRNYLEKGTERVRALAKKLKKESQGLGLGDNTKTELKNLRALFNLYDDKDYGYNLLRLKNTPAELKKIKIGESEKNRNLDGIVTVVAKHPDGIVVYRPNDPLLLLIYHINDYLSFQSYPEMHREFEYEAFLYEKFPPEIIATFFPELVEYTTKLERRAMKVPTPLHNGRALPPIRSDLDNEKYVYLSTLSFVLDAFGGSGFQVDPRLYSLLFDQVPMMMTSHPSSQEIDKMRYFFTKSVLSGIRVGEANKILGQLASIKGDGMDACRHFHRAFKSGIEFTYPEYLDCLKNLMATGNWGDAKIIAQKARAKYSNNLHFVPVELEAIYEKIKHARKGKV